MKDKDTMMTPDIALLDKYFRDESSDMVKFAARLLGNHELAETVVQDCFVFAIENIEKLKDSPNPVGWLYKVLKNFIKHADRDRQIYLKHIVQHEDALELYQPQYDQYSQGILDTSDDPDLRLLVQFYIYGYSLKELAKHYNTEVGSIKMRIKRSKEHLEKRL